MATIDFITSNPAMDEYRRAEESAQKTDSNDIAMLKNIRLENEAGETWPTRLRKINADTSLSETNAQVASDKAPYAGPDAFEDYRSKRAGADISVANAGVAPRNAESGARIQEARATEEEASAGVAKPKAEAGLRQVRATATNTEMEPFYKAVGMLEKGDVDAARETARRAGQEIPGDILSQADLRTAVVTAAKNAQQIYPNRPKLQQDYIQKYVDETRKRVASGGSADEPLAPYTVPNAPPAPEETQVVRDRWQAFPSERVNPATGQPEKGYIKFNSADGEAEFVPGTQITGKAGGAGTQDPAAVRTAKWLVDNKIAPDLNTGYQMARAGVNDATQWQRLVQAEHKALANDPTYMEADAAGKERMARQRVVDRKTNPYTVPPAPPTPPAKPGMWDRMFGTGQQSNAAPATAAPAPAAPAPQRNGQPAEISMKGNGTRVMPYQPTTEDDMRDVAIGSFYVNPADGRTYERKK